MAEDLQEFARRMGRLSVKVEKGVERTVRKVALVIDQALVFSTPVDTGRTRSNWIVSVSAPGSEVIGPYSPGKDLGKGETANAQAALDQAGGVIGNYKLEDGGIFIYNNLPHVKRLNDGSSHQAPAGFIEVAVQRGQEVVRKARIIGEDD